MQIARTSALCIQLCQTSQFVSPPLIFQTAPSMYPQIDSSQIPGGTPMMLLPEVGMVNVQRRISAHGHAPFQMNVEISREHVSFDFSAVDFDCVCKKCGRK
eukprot:11858758-Ditylum_brightwellii.AAC.2